jgi:hypothetical protein
MTAAHRLRYAIKAPVTHDVVIGRQGWLFYGGQYEIEQYLGLRPLSDPQIGAIVGELEREWKFLRSRGIAFVFVIAPNKSSIYPEYLPDGLHRIGPTPADQLMSALAQRPEIPVVDGRMLLRRSKHLGPLYFQTDTHWNDIGAFITLQAVMRRARFGPWRMRPLTDYRIELTTQATDLLWFLNMGIYTEGNVPALSENFALPGMVWRQNSHDRFVSDVITRPAPATHHILVVGDSFSKFWLRFLDANFARVVRVTEPLLAHDDLIEAEKPDIVILEVVERTIGDWWPASLRN